MSDSKGTTIRPAFPLVEPDPSVQPNPQGPTPMSAEEVQARMVSSFEQDFNTQVREKCRTCDAFSTCAAFSVLLGKDLVGPLVDK